MSTPQAFHEVVARRVRGRIAEERISQARLAARFDVSQQTVSRKLNGRQPFTLDELGILAEFLGVTVGDILGEEAAYPQRHSDGGGKMGSWSAPDLRPGHSSPTGRRASDLRRYAYRMRADAHGNHGLRAAA
jgi:transcriptional regulator with XRE-family HTH domain